MLDYLLNRSKKELQGVHSVVAAKAIELINKAHCEGIYVAITQGYRSVDEQNALYAQGRTKPGKKVTNAKGGQSIHNYGLAVDFCIFNKDKQPLWTVDDNWKRVVKIAEELGFESGLHWKFYDPPHLEMTFGLTLAQLKAGKRPSTSTSSTKPVKTQGTQAKVSSTKSIVPYPGKLIKMGSKGKDVERIQRAVGANPDGVFGNETYNKVKAYQRRKGLVVDGIVGKSTWDMLF
ncbi:D-alanyl-D-alanine carboxypeptidase family protein [Priestia flexa]|uniref:D-alanyl-D-alanine carboxypeptidase family protein n=1 Tax=Priestia flexa TaxID=86664 RepID=UPI00240D5475|nr:D-alanyl-D-alanine carboxypeptidase family protein [Priestia flexa]WEZ09595.1 D-alanyl-D-alanine carboxypeptidase family protein [Priestia flexa]